MSETKDYSQLTNSQESWYVLTALVMCSIGLTVTIIMIFSLSQQRNNIPNKQSLRFAIISIICSLFLYVINIFFCNDLIIPWQYDGQHLSFVSITDSIDIIFYSLGKISFYVSFTYHLLSIFDQKSGTRKYLMVWMIIACTLFFGVIMAYLVDDVLQEQSKEIGVTFKHNIHLTMVGGHEGAEFQQLLSFIGMIVDMLYFVVLIYFYIKQLKLMTDQKNLNAENGVKSVVLISVSCLVFWILLILQVTQSSARYLGSAFDVLSDDICLFLMFAPQANLYQFWCKGCDACCWKMIYVKKEHGISQDGDEENESDQQRLIN